MTSSTTGSQVTLMFNQLTKMQTTLSKLSVRAHGDLERSILQRVRAAERLVHKRKAA